MPADVQISTSLSGLRDTQDALKRIEDSLKKLGSANDNLRKSTEKVSKSSKEWTKATNDNTRALRGLGKEVSFLDKAINTITSGYRAFIQHLEGGQKAVSSHAAGMGRLGLVIGKTGVAVEETGKQFSSLTAKLQLLLSKGLLKLSSVLDAVAVKFNSVGNSLLKFGGIITAAIVIPIGIAAQSLITFGAEAQRSESLFRAKLGAMSAEASAFVDLLVRDFGQARTAIQDSVAAFNNFALAVGIGKDTALEMSKALTVLTLDLSALFGGTPKDIFSDFLSTLVGNVIPSLKAMGIVVTASTVKQRGLELGVKGLSTQWSLQQKILIRTLLILEGAKRSLGGFARSMDNPIIQAQIFSNQMQNLRQEIGQKLLPIFNLLSVTFRALIPDFTALGQKFLDLDEATRGWIIAIGGAIVALGPLLLIFGGLFKAIALVTGAVVILTGAFGTLFGIKSIDDIPLIGLLKSLLVTLLQLSFAWAVVQTAAEAFFVTSIPSFDNLIRAALSFQLILANIRSGFTDSPEVRILEAEIARLDEAIKAAEQDFNFGETLGKRWVENLEGMKDAIKPFAVDALEILENFGRGIADESTGFLAKAMGLDVGPEFGTNIKNIVDKVKKDLGDLVGLDFADLSFATIQARTQEFVANLGAEVKEGLDLEFTKIVSDAIIQIQETLAKTKPDVDLKKVAKAAVTFDNLKASILGVAKSTDVLAAAEEFRRKSMVKIEALKKEGIISDEKLIALQVDLAEAVNRMVKKPFKDLISSFEFNNEAIRDNITILKAKIIGDKAEIKALQEKIILKNIVAKLRKDNVPNIEKEIEAVKKLIAIQGNLTKELEDQQKIQKAQEDLIAPFKQAVQSIQDLFSNVFEDLLNGGIDSFEDFAGSVKQIFIKLATEIAALLVFKPIIGNVLGGLGLGAGTLAQLGFPSGGGTISGGPGVPGGGGLGLLSSLGNLTGLGDLGSSISGFLSTPIFQSTFQGGPLAGGAIAGTGSTFGALLGGAGAGFGAGMFLNSLLGGNPTGGAIGSGGGALAGAAIGSMFGPPGALIGGLLGGSAGGALGGLFGGSGSGKPTAGAGVGNVNGRFGTTFSDTSNGGDVTGALALGGQVSQILNTLLDAIGGGATAAGGGQIGTRGGRFWINVDGVETFFSTAEAAVNSLLGSVLGGGGFTGGDPFNAEVARSSLALRGNNFEAVFADINFGEGLKQAVDDLGLTPLELELRDIAEAFDELKERAKELGGALPGLVETLRSADLENRLKDFNEAVRREILGIVDPIQLAMEDLEQDAKDRLKIAQTLGADVLQVEKLNALIRTQIVEGFATRTTAILRGTFAQLASGLAAITGREALGRSLISLQGSVGFAAQGQRSESLDLARLTATLLDIAIDEGFATGGERIFTKPSLISVAERGAERVSVTPLGSSRAGAGTTIVFEGTNFIDELSMVNFERRIQSAVDKSNKGFV